MPLSVRTSLQIFALWFIGGAVIGGGLIFLLRPLAGLFFLMAVVTAISMTVAPIAHIVLRHKGLQFGEIMSTLFIAVVAVFFLLAFTGWFNFT